LLDEIFEENVRDYEGATVINRVIANTLHQGDTAVIDFWWLNNGVTIIGNRVGSSGKRLELEDPQIVNGLQSSKEVYSYFQSISRNSQRDAEGTGYTFTSRRGGYCFVAACDGFWVEFRRSREPAVSRGCLRARSRSHLVLVTLAPTSTRPGLAVPLRSALRPSANCCGWRVCLAVRSVRLVEGAADVRSSDPRIYRS
jgi:AIPR protein